MKPTLSIRIPKPPASSNQPPKTSVTFSFLMITPGLGLRYFLLLPFFT